MSEEPRDITIIGGGPTGLFAAFYAGMRGATSRIVDSLPELGGQLTALYPEKYIFDVGGFPKILAKDLAVRLVEQAMQFEPEVVLDEEILEIEPTGDGFSLRGREASYATKAVVIAGGKGAFEPRALKCPGYEEYLGRGVEYAVRDADALAGERILIVGGGDSAVDWALTLKETASELTLIHRREGFRAHERSMELLREADAADEIDLRTYWEVREIRGDERVRECTIFENRTDEERVVEVDAVLAMLGFKPDLGPIAEWGLELEKNRIVVGPTMETNRPGIFAAGDIVSYVGKLDLIATGFSEAAIAVNHAVQKVDPDARVNPGHSTHMEIFKEK